jgi:hypothetical protein
MDKRNNSNNKDELIEIQGEALDFLDDEEAMNNQNTL